MRTTQPFTKTLTTNTFQFAGGHRKLPARLTRHGPGKFNAFRSRGRSEQHTHGLIRFRLTLGAPLP